MSTSGTSTFNETVQQIINNALQLLGVIGSNDTVQTNDYNFCLSMLNQMVKAWQSMGIHLWKEDEAILPAVIGQNIYKLSTTSSDHAGEDAIETTLTASSSGGSLIVVSTSGMTNGDNIGIQLDSGIRYWTTISSVVDSTHITLVGSLTSNAAAGNSVCSYTTELERPLQIMSVRYHYQGGLERKLKQYGRSQFMALPNKATQAPSTVYYYSPQLTNGLLYVWPTPTTCADSFHISYLRNIQDLVNSTDNPDFPQEWLDPVVHNLACRIAPAYGITLSKTNPDLIRTASSLLAEMYSWDTEEGSIMFNSDYRYDN